MSFLLRPPTLETPHIYEHLDNHISKAEFDPETPPNYHHFPSPERLVPSRESSTQVNARPSPLDHATAIDNLQTETVGMRGELTNFIADFHGFIDVVTKQLDHI